jgi:AraC family transcriptional regulator, melibiose operon regulatory protein
MEYKYELIRTEEDLPIKMIIHTSENRQFVPRHWHESIEISYVLSGKIDEIYVDGKMYESGPGDIVLINSNAIHSFSLSMGKNRKAATIFIPYEFLKMIYPDCDQMEFDCISIGCKQQKQFEELRENLDLLVHTYENRKHDPLAYIKITSYSYKLIYILLKDFKVFKKNSSKIRAKKHLERLTLITNYINENYQQNLSLELVAAQFNLSMEYLSRFFAKHTGMTVLNYINAIRLEKSYPDLMNSDYPIIQIALDHGFPNEKSYIRVFKSVYHLTPNQYRKQRRNT